MQQLTYARIEEGKLEGKLAIVNPRVDLPENLFLVEVGQFLGGAPMFALHCLNKGCEMQIPSSNGCPKCNGTTKSN